MSLGHMVRLH